MTPHYSKKHAVSLAVLLGSLLSGYACSSDSGSGGSIDPGKAANSACEEHEECASQSCVDKQCAPGVSLDDGKSCAKPGECKSGLCTKGICGAADSTGSGGTGSNGAGGSTGYGEVTAETPPFDGLGTDWRPLTTGCGPETASSCSGACEASPDGSVTVVRPPALLCFGADETAGVVDPTTDTPAAIIEQTIEEQNGVEYVHIRVTFDPSFADNTYGANASPDWYAEREEGKAGKGHTFTSDLTGSDHLELLVTDGAGETALDFKIDYISSLTDTGGGKPGGGKPGAPKPGDVKPGDVAAGGATSSTTTAAASSEAYGTLGVLGGDGAMITGDSGAILATATSISRNVGGCGYKSSTACSAGSTGEGDGDCTVNSPVTDENYTPNPETPNWNYAVVYEAWIDLKAFGEAGFGQAYINSIHASPSKLSSNTLVVVPSPCPPGWGTCIGGGCETQGQGGASGNGGDGNGTCPTNYQLYVTTEGASDCTPIPFAGYPDHRACPDGYELDIPSEGRYCVPITE